MAPSVVAYAVSGAKVHDARLVAAMLTHDVRHILTLNTAISSATGELLPSTPATSGSVPDG